MLCWAWRWWVNLLVLVVVGSYVCIVSLIACLMHNKTCPPFMIWRKEHEASCTKPSRSTLHFSHQQHTGAKLLTTKRTMSSWNLLACMLVVEMNWPTNVTQLYLLVACCLLLVCLVSLHAWYSPVMKEEASSSLRSMKHLTPNPAPIPCLASTSYILPGPGSKLEVPG